MDRFHGAPAKNATKYNRRDITRLCQSGSGLLLDMQDEESRELFEVLRNHRIVFRSKT